MLNVTDISKSIKGKKIVSKVSFEINKSDIFGLLGPNGAGKTSTFLHNSWFDESRRWKDSII